MQVLLGLQVHAADASADPCLCVHAQATITVPYSGQLTMALDSGANFTIPVSGLYRGTAYAPAVRTLSARYMHCPVMRGV